MVISATLVSYYSWKQVSKVSSLVQKQIDSRIESVINSILSSIYGHLASEMKIIERVLSESKFEFERAIIKLKGYDTIDKQSVKERTEILFMNTDFTDFNFYVVNPKGDIVWATEADSEIHALLSMQNFLDCVKEELALKGICVYPFSFAGFSGVGRTLAFQKLSNGDIIALSLKLNPELYLPQIEKVKDFSIFIEKVRLFNLNGIPITFGDTASFKPLKWWEFYKRDLKNTFYVNTLGTWSEPLNAYIRLNFLEMHSIFIVSVLVFFALLILTYIVAFKEYRAIRKDIGKIQNYVSKLEANEYPQFDSQDFKIKEVFEVASTLSLLVNRLKEEERKSIDIIIRRKEAFVDFAEKLAIVAESYEHQTGEHLMRVKYLTGLIVNRLELDRDYADQIINYSVLHDIGKIYIPIDVLQAQRKLNPAEWELVKKHTIYGANLFSDPEFLVAKEICLYHHENYDGSGYPFGLRGEEIPLPGRIVKIVDVYDALRSESPYKRAYTHSQAVKIMTEGDERVKPGDFDPVLISIFLEEIEKVDLQSLYGG